MYVETPFFNQYNILEQLHCAKVHIKLYFRVLGLYATANQHSNRLQCVCVCPVFDTLGPALATATDTWLFASYGELFRSATIYYSCRKWAASFPFDHQFEFTQRLQCSRYVPCHCIFHPHTHHPVGKFSPRRPTPGDDDRYSSRC